MDTIYLDPFTRIGNVQLLRRLGEGSFGMVWEGKNIDSSVNVIVKITPFFLDDDSNEEEGGIIEDESIIEDFCREIFVYRTIAAINVQEQKTICNIVSRCASRSFVTQIPFKNHASGTRTFLRAGILIFRKPQGDSVSLENYMRYTLPAIKSIDPVVYWEHVELITLSLLRDIRDLHAHGIYHRDIKPGNILVDTVPIPGTTKMTINTVFIDYNGSWISNPDFNIFAGENNPLYRSKLRGIKDALGGSKFNQIVWDKKMPAFISDGRFATTAFFYNVDFSKNLEMRFRAKVPEGDFTYDALVGTGNLPESLAEYKEPGHREIVDIYAAGITIYKILLGPEQAHAMENQIFEAAKASLIRRWMASGVKLKDWDVTRYEDEYYLSLCQTRPSSTDVDKFALGRLINLMIGNRPVASTHGDESSESVAQIPTDMNMYLLIAGELFVSNRRQMKKGGEKEDPCAAAGSKRKTNETPTTDNSQREKKVGCDMCTSLAVATCSRCDDRAYCSVACQKRDWIEARHCDHCPM